MTDNFSNYDKQIRFLKGLIELEYSPPITQEIVREVVFNAARDGQHLQSVPEVALNRTCKHLETQYDIRQDIG